MRQALYGMAQSWSRKLLGMELEMRPLAHDRGTASGTIEEIYVPAVGLTLGLDLSETLDRRYASNSIEAMPFAFLREHLDECTLFADVGSNQGLYSCVALNESKTVRVMAVEPDPYSRGKLERNLVLNGLDAGRISVFGVAVGSEEGEVDLMLNTAGNRAGSSVLIDQRAWTGLAENDTVRVPQRTLLGLLRETRTDAGPWMIKLDIEGLEYPVLAAFFDNALEDEWPAFVMVEAFGRLIPLTGGSPVQLLIQKGYDLVDHDEFNFCLAKPAAS